jgi:hypothetical protein
VLVSGSEMPSCRRPQEGVRRCLRQCLAGRYYLVDAQRCDCPDAHRHPGQACKHILAVRLHCELVKAQQRTPRRPRFVVSHTNAAGEVIHLPARFETD